MSALNIIDKNTIIDQSIDFRDGQIILVDKPLEWTSFDVVNKIRFRLKRYHGIKKIKVGHNGTLDPLATGLLMVFTGKYTKLIPEMESHDKSYVANIKFGATTESLDRETEEREFTEFTHISSDKINACLDSLIGERIQEIPIYSASKQGGIAMYKLAREGKEVNKKFKNIIYHSLTLEDMSLPFCRVNVKCSKGTYIRSFARELGECLQSSAYLYGLVRTEIDRFHLSKAVSLEEFCNKLESIEYSC